MRYYKLYDRSISVESLAYSSLGGLQLKDYSYYNKRYRQRLLSRHRIGNFKLKHIFKSMNMFEYSNKYKNYFSLNNY